MAPVERQKVKTIVDDLMANGIVRESTSEFASPVILVKRKNGDDHMRTDFRELDDNTVSIKFPLPIISDQIDQLADASYFICLEVRQFVDNCVICKINKGSSGAKQVHMYPIEKKPILFQIIHIDMTGRLTKRNDKHEYVVLIIDAYTKYTTLTYATNKTAVYMLNALKKLVSLFRAPHQIISDQDTAFNAEFDAYCKEYNIHQLFIAPGVSRSNGQVERMMAVVKSGLTIIRNYETADWKKGLDAMQLAINCTKNKTTNMSTLKALRGRSCAVPAELVCLIDEAEGLTLWKNEASPTSNTVRMVGAILGLQFQLEEPDIFGGETKTPEFKKKNPMSTIPVLKDGDFFVSDSHAIVLYLLNKYGGANKERLYPSDLRTRALVDQALFFDTGVMFRQLLNASQPTFRGMITGPTPTNIEQITDAYAVLEAWLQTRPYIAASHITIADLSLGTSVAGLQGIHVLDGEKFPRTRDWLSRLEAESYFKEITTPSAALLGKILKSFWEKNKKGEL